MNNYKKLESGRSMIEMLGVLAIIGVLSVGGIAGYSKAMNKFKTNKVADNVSMLVANIKTLYAQQNTYTGLDNENAVKLGVVPEELGTDEDLKNAFSGDVTIAASDSSSADDDRAFTLQFDSLSKEACIALATNDWGSGYSSGLIYMKVSKAAITAEPEGSKGYVGCTGSASDTDGYVACPGGSGLKLPMPVATAVDACACTTASCSIQWKYY